MIHIGFPATISSWNNLPFGIEKVDRVEGFKLKLKEHTIRSPKSESNIGVILNLESCQLTIRRSIIAAGIFTCDGCARDPYFYVPAETQSYVIKLSCSRKVLAASGV